MRHHALRTLTAAAVLWCGVASAQLPAMVGDAPVPSLAPMLKKVSPSVVNIATRGTVQAQSQQGNPLLEDPFFRRFFEAPELSPQQREFQAAGSGVIVDARNGYIITNAHVIENASEITVTLLDNRAIKAEVVGADAGSDVALLKVKASNLSAMPLADSAKAEVGDFVVAIGNPFGLQHTVTSGIISGLGRSGISRDGYEDFIQTDASINPGNSGGALVNLKGELVGVNSAILSGNGGGNIGIGFAIPSNMVKAIMDQIVQFGEVKRGVLGVNIVTLTPDVAQNLGIADAQGALVSQVVEGSAAEKAGVRAGDVITAVNNRTVKTGAELRNAIGLLRVGDKVEITLLREGKPRRVTANVGTQESGTVKKAATLHKGLDGAEFADAEGGAGVRITAVAANSPAAQSGLRANDLIIGVGQARVANLDQLGKATANASAFALTVRRGSATVIVVVR
ncbi:MAG: Do family serine endopeptidase [Steroidobacteraceae bacterium]